MLICVLGPKKAIFGLFGDFLPIFSGEMAKLFRGPKLFHENLTQSGGRFTYLNPLTHIGQLYIIIL